MLNLDYTAAKYGQAIIEECRCKPSEAEDAATKALAILHEQGIFAMFLWLHETDGKGKPKAGRDSVGLQLCKMLAETPHITSGKYYDEKKLKEALNAVRDNLCRDITTMFFVKDLMAQALVYARHRGKAEPKNDEKKNGEETV